MKSPIISFSGNRVVFSKYKRALKRAVLQYKGIDLNSIKQIAGHSSISTTQRYIQDNPHLMADILKSI